MQPEELGKMLYVAGHPTEDIAEQTGLSPRAIQRLSNTDSWRGARERYELIVEERFIELTAEDALTRMTQHAKDVRIIRSALMNELLERMNAEEGKSLKEIDSDKLVRLYAATVELEREVIGADKQARSPEDICFEVLDAKPEPALPQPPIDVPVVEAGEKGTPQEPPSSENDDTRCDDASTI